MKTKIYFILLAALALSMPSCGEINDPDEPKYEDVDSEEEPESDPKPDKDGIVQTSGMVDLGLSVKWAARDLDVNTSDHFAESCKENGSLFYGTTTTISGNLPSNLVGTSYDNATSLLGEGWSTPTKGQVQELIDNCRITYTVYEDTTGFIITGKNNNAIFFPTTNSYWTSTVDSSSSKTMYYFYLKYECYIIFQTRNYYNFYTYYIRPVHN